MLFRGDIKLNMIIVCNKTKENIMVLGKAIWGHPEQFVLLRMLLLFSRRPLKYSSCKIQILWQLEKAYSCARPNVEQINNPLMPRSWQRFDAGAFEYFKLQLSPMTMTTIITIVTMIIIITEDIPIINIINDFVWRFLSWCPLLW